MGDFRRCIILFACCISCSANAINTIGETDETNTINTAVTTNKINVTDKASVLSRTNVTNKIYKTNTSDSYAVNPYIANAYTDITYIIVGTFSVKGTTFGIGDQTFYNLTAKTKNPRWGTNGGQGNHSPFDLTPPNKSSGYVRIRFPNQGNECSAPLIQSNAALVEWYFPIDIKQTNGAEVNVNMDHSAGIIDTTLANCGAGDAACKNYYPGMLNNDWKPSLNNGTFAGTTLKWDSCLPASSGNNEWNFAKARKVTGPGCIKYNAYGNVSTSSDMVPSSGKGDSYQTWNQQLQPFVFSGTDPLTATFTMAAMQIPNATGQSNTWLELTSSKVISRVCVPAPENLPKDIE